MKGIFVQAAGNWILYSSEEGAQSHVQQGDGRKQYFSEKYNDIVGI